MEAGDGVRTLVTSRDAELRRLYATVGLPAVAATSRVSDTWSGLIPRTFDMLFEVR